MSRLDEREVGALRDALEDEYRGWATYDQVVRDFGPVRPFINIRESEARHIEALRALFARHGLDVPDNTWPGRVERFDSAHAACVAAVTAEIENGALYERLLESTAREDILRVFHNLKEASEERHLAAFRRCAERQGGGRGPGGGRGRGPGGDGARGARGSGHGGPGPGRGRGKA